jgi:hypothetical protein
MEIRYNIESVTENQVIIRVSNIDNTLGTVVSVEKEVWNDCKSFTAFLETVKKALEDWG